MPRLCLDEGLLLAPGKEGVGGQLGGLWSGPPLFFVKVCLELMWSKPPGGQVFLCPRY